MRTLTYEQYRSVFWRQMYLESLHQGFGTLRDVAHALGRVKGRRYGVFHVIEGLSQAYKVRLPDDPN